MRHELKQANASQRAPQSPGTECALRADPAASAELLPRRTRVLLQHLGRRLMKNPVTGSRDPKRQFKVVGHFREDGFIQVSTYTEDRAIADEYRPELVLEMADQ